LKSAAPSLKDREGKKTYVLVRARNGKRYSSEQLGTVKRGKRKGNL